MHFTIVSYTFPPSKEIGGRRWAKFSQQLSRLGHKVTVVCANNKIDNNWYEKDFAGIDVRILPKCYPDWLSGITNSILEQFLYLIYTKFWNLITKKNIFDKGFAWRKPMLNELEKIHKQNSIDVLVVTGAPFSLLLYGTEFKIKHKQVIYVGDLRDPWTWGSYYGISNLSIKKKKFQELSEYKTIQTCDMVCCPTQHMLDVLTSKYPSYTSKLYLLPHAYDPDKISKTKDVQKREGFIYGGTLYDNIEEYIKLIAKSVKNNPSINFKWDIFSAKSYPLLDSVFEKGVVNKYPLIPEEELFQKIQNSAAYLIVFPETDKDLISTKFFEIIYTETPILYIGEDGEVGKFITNNHLGVHILPKNIEVELPKYLNGKVPFIKGFFDVSNFTFLQVTRKFIEDLKRIA